MVSINFNTHSHLIVLSGLFLFALSRHTELLPLIPVPLAHLVGRHANLGSDLHLLSVCPIGVSLEGLVQDSHLGGFFPHSSSHLPLVHVVLLEHESHLSHVWTCCLA